MSEAPRPTDPDFELAYNVLIGRADERGKVMKIDPWGDGMRRVAEWLKAESNRRVPASDAPTVDTSDWPQRFKVFAIDMVNPYDALSEELKEICEDAAEFARRRVQEALAASESLREAIDAADDAAASSDGSRC